MSKSVPASRPVHPCVLSIFDGNTGAEYATWAHVTTKKDELPNLVTAQGSTLRIYTVDDGASGKLALTHSFTDLAGTVCFLESLHVQEAGYPDSFLIGFAGHPRLAVVSVAAPSKLISQPAMLEATTLIDMTQTLMDQSLGAVTPLEQDLIATVEQKNSNTATLSVILGGGVAVAAITLRFVRGRNDARSGWCASEPYLLPLATLQRSLQTESVEGGAPPLTGLAQSISHGFGDIISACFLSGYLEPTLVLLHSNRKHGRTWSGRLGRSNGEGGTHYGLVATAVSLTVAHHRSAVLWSVEVPADALSLHAVGEVGCVVMSVNSLAQITNSGHMSSILAVNGWAQSTCPSGLLDRLQPNPWPLPKLAIQLDGARMSFVSEQVAIVSLRQGQLYLLQHLSGTLSLMALGRTLGAVGQISNLLTLPLADVPKAMLKKLTFDNEKKQPLEMLSVGLLFAGSRLGDSSLLGYTLEGNVTYMDNVKQEEGKGKKQKVEDGLDLAPVKEENKVVSHCIDEYEVILQREEEALYAPTDGENTGLDEVFSGLPDVIPPSSDEETDELVPFVAKKRGRSKLVKLTLLRSLNPLDTITSLGPLGPGCEGPLSKPSAVGNDSVPKLPQAATSSPLGATIRMFPCGYGSSGGLALLTLPGRDDRSILAEADCLNAQCIFSLPLRGLVLLGMRGSGVSVLRVQHSNAGSTTSDVGVELSEVDLEDWCLEEKDGDDGFLPNPLSIFREMMLLSAADVDKDTFACLVTGKGGSGGNEPACAVVTLAEIDGKLRTVKSHPLVFGELDSVRSVTPMVSHELAGESSVTFGCTWSSGKASITTVGPTGTFETQYVNSVDTYDTAETEHETEEERYYRSDQIHAIDVFLAPEDTFTCNVPTSSSAPSSFTQDCESVGVISSTELEFDDEDAELYRNAHTSYLSSQDNSTRSQRPTDNTNATMERAPGSKRGDKLHVAVCRQSGMLEVYVLSNDKNPTLSTRPIWESPGCGQGASILAGPHSSFRHPRMHKVHTSELRFFFTGPTPQTSINVSPEQFRTFNLIVQTSDGDVFCYEKNKTSSHFSRVPLHNVARQSNEESRHRAKLRRKGILGSTDADQSHGDDNVFRFNRLHPFTGISGQDGVFAAITRPLWFVSERGSLAVLSHRCRHVAPAGGKPLPVAGFCVGLLGQRGDTDRGFLTLHERIGRVGTQRLTAFRGISNILSPHGIFPGGGLCVEKVPLGVTVRAIQFIDDPSVSSGAHPLYVVLISREIESDQSHLNDDGLTLEEKWQTKAADEAERIRRQVEADLGGFDLEQEWVEEIEREDCFAVNFSLGGAPPIQKRAYALWVVDASNNWNVVDSHEFEEFEHAMTMEVMSLTEVNEDPGSNAASNVEEGNATNTLFIAVGIGLVDKDGEDVSSKGRVLLFHVNRQGSASLALGSTVADLSLVYEKDILHGPVTSLSCLACEGRNRIVIGAGADINVEQWGNGRLHQVGFFRANMQILHILLFKTFFLLSDAYDSLYFLVWRESDKSLTLLAKDYEPIPVFSVGLMSRGGSMTFLCHDDRQNLQFFQYAPGDPAARGGNKLVCRADIHLGLQTIGLQSFFCRSSLLINSATPMSTLAALKQQDSLFGRTDDDQRLGVYFGTSDGVLGTAVPLSEPVYWRLNALQSVIANALDSNCSLSHRAWRLYRRTPRRGGCRSNDRKKSVIDGDLVMQFADLPLPDQEDLAGAIGSTVELILDNLLELRCASMVI